MSTHAHPSFQVKVAAKLAGGFVVENAGHPGEFFNLWKGSLSAKGKADAANAAYDAFNVGDLLEVTCQDPENHAHHRGPDGAMRPNVSTWLVQVARNAGEAQTKVDTARAWQRAGGGFATVVEVRDAYLLASVTFGASSFTGLWHQSSMPKDFRFSDLKEGTKIPLALTLLESQVQGSRAVIRFQAA